MEKWRDRKFRLMLYPEDPTHLEAISTLANGGYKFASILHDMDVWEEGEEIPDGCQVGDKKKEHVHVVVKFQQPKWSSALAKELGVKENYIKHCDCFDEALKYLVHEGWPDKYQYELDAVNGPLKPNLGKLLAASDEGSRVLEIIKLIDEVEGSISCREALIRVANNGLYGEFRRLGIFGKMLIDEHNADIIECDRIVQMRKTEFDEFREYIKWRECAESAGYAKIIR